MKQELQNPLYPIFLKLHQLNMLIVGAGEVGHEKLHFILKSSPDAQITIIAPWISNDVYLLVGAHQEKVKIIKRHFEVDDVANHDLIIAATNIPFVNEQVRAAAKNHHKLVNVADTPALCDFYLGSIVTRGNLKIAISTNGTSPTLAKRFRQVLEEVLPHEVNNLLDNLKGIRDQLKGSFSYKVKTLNDITAGLLESGEIPSSEDENNAQSDNDKGNDYAQPATD